MLRASLRRPAAAILMATAALLTGCAAPAPNYGPSIDNVEVLKRAAVSPARTGTITVTPGTPGADAIQLRANTIVSPVGSNYGDYIAAALRQELQLAGLYNAQAGTEVSGTLLKNNIDAGGINTNEGQIEARFVVTRGGQQRFDKIKKVEHQWEGAFAGMVAIPRAASNYPVMVQKLITSLVTDPDFTRALRD